MQNRKPQLGFTLVEVMIVCVVVGILANFAIPSLMRARLTTNEGKIQQDLRNVAAAAEIYRGSQAVPVYPQSLSDLSKDEIPILDPAVTAGKQNGYNFTLIAGQDKNSFICYANPIQFGVTGKRSFCVDHLGVIKEYSQTITTSDAFQCPTNDSLVSAQPVETTVSEAPVATLVKEATIEKSEAVPVDIKTTVKKKAFTK